MGTKMLTGLRFNASKVSYQPDGSHGSFAPDAEQKQQGTSVPTRNRDRGSDTMVRLFNVYFPKRVLQLIGVESFLIVGALYCVALLHFGPGTSALDSEPGCLKIALVAGVCLPVLYYSDVYSRVCLRKTGALLSRLIKGLGAAAILISLVYYIFPAVQLYRGYAITGICLTAGVLILNRRLFAAVNWTGQHGGAVVILGDGALAAAIAGVIEDRPELGFRMAGYLGGEWTGEPGRRKARRLGGLADVGLVVSGVRPSRVIVAMGERRCTLPVDDLLVLKTSGVVVQDGSDFYEIATGKLPVESIRPSWLIFSPGFKVSRLTLIYKRVVSIVIAFVGLLMLLPIIVLIALAIRFDTPGPIIFRQKRIGLRGQSFTLFKFRTMHVNADQGGYARPAEHGDRRVTRVGRVLRRLRLDEIPQLWNILIGEMHFVGPRPFVPEQETDCAAQIPLYTYRWSVRPGATGWAQVQRGYCASLRDNVDKLAYDLFYIKNMSLGLDLMILFKTIKILFSAQGGR